MCTGPSVTATGIGIGGPPALGVDSGTRYNDAGCEPLVNHGQNVIFAHNEQRFVGHDDVGAGIASE